MAESPLASPHAPDVARSGTNSPAPQTTAAASTPTSAPLHSASAATTAGNSVAASPATAPNSAYTPSLKTSDSEFLDMDDEDSSVYDTASAAERSTMSTSTVESDPRAANATSISTSPDAATPHNEATDTIKSRPSMQAIDDDDFPFPLPAGDITSQRYEPSRSFSAANSSLVDTPTTPTANAYANSSANPEPSFRALPLLARDLPRTRIVVSQSSIRPNDRGKDVLSFVIVIDAGNGKEPWAVEKMYSDVVGLDQRIRSRYGRSISKKVPHLPDGRLWRDHAPSRVDQRKAVLEKYLQTLLALPVKNNDEVIAFLTSDVVRTTNKPVARLGYKEGYLTKRGKNFGGWKTRFFVLQGPVLEYYESRGGTHLGSIPITGAQIGRQQKPVDRRETEEESEYRHAFLIIEARKGSGTGASRHVLCAESDEERDHWVEMLVRYVSGTFNDDLSTVAGQSGLSLNTSVGNSSSSQPRSSTSSNAPMEFPGPSRGKPTRGMSKDEISIERAVPLSQLPVDANNAKLFSSVNSIDEAPTNETAAQRLLNKGKSASLPQDSPLSSSLPSPSTLSTAAAEPDGLANLGPRANSELGHYPDMRAPQSVDQSQQATPQAKAKVISGPINGAPIPAGYKFGAVEPPPVNKPETKLERREKSKSRLWGWSKDRVVSGPQGIARAVFGVALDEALEVAQIAHLPAVVFRCIQYLEAKKAHEEEGIYRLSGSSVVIKNLKDRFNAEGDVDLLTNDEHWDPHAIAGLLKTFFRELPSNILTGSLHLRFMRVMDLVSTEERLVELTRLVRLLPLSNYSLLRALSAHLIQIVDNHQANKMTMRNVGIVFSPTLGIPAGVFSLMLGAFDKVFDVEDPSAPAAPASLQELDRRNSRQYSDAAADRLLGLAGRKLSMHSSGQGSPYDDDEESISIQEESGTEGSVADGDDTASEPSPTTAENNGGSRIAAVAAGRGLTVNTSGESKRMSRMIGLPASPRPNPNSPHVAHDPHGHTNTETLQVPR